MSGMAFYIKPPKGVVSHRKLQKYADKRFRFLVDLSNCEGDDGKIAKLLRQVTTVDGSECLIIGSQCDRISHFIIRLALHNSPAEVNWFIKSEVNLFKIRLNLQTDHEKQKCLQEAEHQIVKLSSLQPPFYRQILLTLKSIRKLMTNCKNSDNIKVPFEHALAFVRKRELPLQNGCLIVPVQKIGELLVSLHELILQEGIKQMKRSNCARNASIDSRVKDIAKQLQHHFSYKFLSYKPSGTLLARNVDNISRQFPPCMLHLYRILKIRHRLQHKARVQLTLFLKDIGMPLEEALSFWENEYSKPAVFNSACSHSWFKERQRYIYNIRHLYGQEGSLKNYRCQSCTVLQDGLTGTGTEGGCPFAQFDIENIEKLLLMDNIKGQHANEITNCVHQKRYRDACLHYLIAQFFNNNTNPITSCASTSYNIDTYNIVSKNLLCHETSNVRNTNEFLECRPFASTTSVTGKSNVSFTKMNCCIMGNECYSSEISNDSHVCRKMIHSQIMICKPIDYYKSYQDLLERI